LPHFSSDKSQKVFKIVEEKKINCKSENFEENVENEIRKNQDLTEIRKEVMKNEDLTEIRKEVMKNED
jgi:hypothetical protein